MDVVGANFAADARYRSRSDSHRTRPAQGRPVPIVIPIGSGSVKDSHTPFKGVIDLIEMKAIYFDPGRLRQAR